MLTSIDKHELKELRRERDRLRSSTNTLTRELAKEKARVEVLEKGLNAVHELIDNSYGVTGLHLNGDTAKWSELLEGGGYEEWLVDFSKALNRGLSDGADL